MINMRIIKDGEYYFLEIENKEELEKLKKLLLKKAKEKQKRRLT
jgi:hypothetical protein